MDKYPNPSNPAKNAVLKPYKEAEFSEFVKFIGNGGIPNWSILAEVLDINRETVARWKKHPLARAAIINAIEENLHEMKASGKDDWKMHREMLRMLGVKDKNSIENYTNAYDDIKATLDQLERENPTDYDLVAEQARKELEKLENKPLVEPETKITAQP